MNGQTSQINSNLRSQSCQLKDQSAKICTELINFSVIYIGILIDYCNGQTIILLCQICNSKTQLTCDTTGEYLWLTSNL